MMHKVNGFLTALLGGLGAIGTGFLCASAGLSWAKIKFGGICDSDQYLMLYYGVCDKVSIRSIGEADRHCLEWRDDSTWESAGSEFEDGAFNWQIIGYLIGAAAILGFVATCIVFAYGCNFISTTSAASISSLAFCILSLGLSIAGWALALQTAQLDKDEWESALPCPTKVELGAGLACAVLASILFLLTSILAIIRTKALV